MSKKAHRKTASEPKTLVTFVLDRSGSMESIKADTIGAFNTYLDTLRDAKNMEFTLVQFDSVSLDKVCVRVPVIGAPKLNDNNYVPRGSTPLVDASYKCIKAVEEYLGLDKETKVVIAIQTDGHENCSQEYSFEQLNALIKEKTALGWQFLFMGASIDAYDQGARMGISRGSTVSYNAQDQRATQDAFVASASNTRSFASGLAPNAEYSAAQKSAAGDVYDSKVRMRQPSLTPTPQPQAPDPKIIKSKSKPVDDFSL